MMQCSRKLRSACGKCKIVWMLFGCLLLGVVFPFVIHQATRKVPVQNYLNQPLPFTRDIDLIRYFDKRGFNLSVMPNKTSLWTRDVQLCIMFNTVVGTRALGLLLSYYQHFFNHITLITGTEVIAKPRFVPDSVRMFHCNSYYGWYQQKCMKICMENPAVDGMEGFLYIADDMFINITKMGYLDRTKLWTIPFLKFNFTQLMQTNKAELHKVWWWFGYPRYLEDNLDLTIKALPKEWMTALKTNAGFPDRYETASTADIYYIPTHQAPKMIEVMTFIINTRDLFNEVTLPLTIGIITNPSEREILSSGYLWENNRTLLRKEALAETAHFVHPLKLSYGGDSQLWTKLMKEQLRQASNVTSLSI